MRQALIELQVADEKVRLRFAPAGEVRLDAVHEAHATACLLHSPPGSVEIMSE
jgi:hypothetical protein